MPRYEDEDDRHGGSRATMRTRTDPAAGAAHVVATKRTKTRIWSRGRGA